MKTRIVVGLLCLLLPLLSLLLVPQALAEKAVASQEIALTATRKTMSPDTLVCVFRPGDTAAIHDLILPIGGIWKGKWQSGEAWRKRLPKGSNLSVYSTTAGKIGLLRITGRSQYFAWPEFSGWKGNWRQTTREPLDKLLANGYQDSTTVISSDDDGYAGDTGDLALAIWRKGGTPVKWQKCKLLKRSTPPYKNIVQNYFISKGLEKYLAIHKLAQKLSSRIKVDHLLSVDIDTDGKDEVLVSADWSEFNDAGTVDSTPGVSSWTCLLLVDYEISDQPVAKTIALSTGGEPDRAQEVLGCADIDNNGKPEIITRYRLGNPDAFSIYTLNPVRKVADFSFLYGE